MPETGYLISVRWGLGPPRNAISHGTRHTGEVGLCAGFRTPATGARGWRPKSAKARNRWKGAASVPRALWGFGRGVCVDEVGPQGLLRSVCRKASVSTPG